MTGCLLTTILLLPAFTQRELFVEHINLYVIVGRDFRSQALKAELTRQWKHKRMEEAQNDIKKWCTIIWVDSEDIKQCQKHRIKRYHPSPALRFGEAEKPIVMDKRGFKCSSYPLLTTRAYVTEYFLPNILRDTNYESELQWVTTNARYWQYKARLHVEDNLPFDKWHLYYTVLPNKEYDSNMICTSQWRNGEWFHVVFDFDRMRNDFDGFDVPHFKIPVKPKPEWPWNE